MKAPEKIVQTALREAQSVYQKLEEEEAAGTVRALIAPMKPLKSKNIFLKLENQMIEL